MRFIQINQGVEEIFGTRCRAGTHLAISKASSAGGDRSQAGVRTNVRPAGAGIPGSQGPVDSPHAAHRKRWVTARSGDASQEDVPGSTPGLPPLVAQSGRAPPKGGCRRFDSCPRSQDLDWKYRSKDHPPNAGERPRGCAATARAPPRQPVAVCASTRHSPRPQPATLPPCLQGSNHGALQGPGCAPWHPAIAVTAP